MQTMHVLKPIQRQYHINFDSQKKGNFSKIYLFECHFFTAGVNIYICNQIQNMLIHEKKLCLERVVIN